MGELVISGKRLLAYLLSDGGKVIRSKGSHFFVSYKNKLTTIPIHKNEDLPSGTLRKIMKDLDLSRENILKAK